MSGFGDCTDVHALAADGMTGVWCGMGGSLHMIMAVAVSTWLLVSCMLCVLPPTHSTCQHTVAGGLARLVIYSALLILPARVHHRHCTMPSSMAIVSSGKALVLLLE